MITTLRSLVRHPRAEGRYRYDRVRDNLCLWLARRMPWRMRYWATVVSGAEATCGVYGSTVVPEVTFMEVLHRTHHERKAA